jgi:hypothetical protein
MARTWPSGAAFCCGGGDQGVDLGEGAVFVDVELREGGHDLDSLADLLALEAEFEGDAAGLVGLQAQDGVQGLADDGLGAGVGDLLDVHAALSAGDEHVAAGLAVGGDGEVVLVGDIDARGDEQLGDLEALSARLVADHAVGKHEAGGLGGLLGGSHELDEARLAAAAGVDLGLDDGEGGGGAGFAGDLLVGAGGFLEGLDHDAGGHGDTGLGEEVTGLVFVDLHGFSNDE